MQVLAAADFQDGRLQRTGRWVVDFSADWCPFCHQFLPAFHALEGRLDARLAIGDVTDLASPLWETFRLDAVPTVVVFEEGHPSVRLDAVLGEGLTPAQLLAFTEKFRNVRGP
jgi:thioredoxin-like negative regulator of GroEL